MHRTKYLNFPALFLQLMLFSLLVLSSHASVKAEEVKAAIVLNQVGYHPDWPKRAMIINEPSIEFVALIEKATGDPVQMITPEPAQPGGKGIQTQILDFSKVTEPGEYYLEGGDLRSASFSISKTAFENTTRLLLRSYYLQRCGVELLDEETGLSHQACHLSDGVYARDDEFNKGGEFQDAVGGWHDAGDYGKYLAPASVTVNRLLSLYLRAPHRYPDGALGIPESGNKVSDLLDEVAYELDWMIKMQRADGAVYRKLSGAKWPSVISPDEDTQPRYIYGVSSPETGKFSASMALAARAYRKQDPERAHSYLVAAEKAWDWLKFQPEQSVDWKKEDDSGSGSYLSSKTDTEANLETDTDDRVTAAVELYLTTGKTIYRDYIQAFEPEKDYSLYEWKDASSLSLWHLMHEDKSPELRSIRADVKHKLMARADELLVRTQFSAFNLANDRVVWGSNKMTAEEGITLAHAWHLTGDKRYLAAAVDQLDYVLGRNLFNLSFVTEVGERSVKNPVHIFGRAVKRTIPGLMVGGPNEVAQDGIAPKGQGLMSYVDHERAYSVNEYAIDYNVTLIGLIEVLSDYQSRLAHSEDLMNELGTEGDGPDLAHLTPNDLESLVPFTPKKVLFIGNSFTYYNNSLHYHVEQLRRSDPGVKDFQDYNFRAATIAGGFLSEHKAGLDSLTEGRGWDVVVLQGHSREAIDKDKRIQFEMSLAESTRLLKARGMKPLLFMTWAYRHKPEMIDALKKEYVDLAKKFDLTLVPVGAAFEAALQARPDLSLHAADGIHPSVAGSYLAACVFYSVLYNESPLGLGYQLGLDDETVKFLQSIAWKSVTGELAASGDFGFGHIKATVFD